MHKLDTFLGVDVLDTEYLFCLLDTGIGQGDTFKFFINREIILDPQIGGDGRKSWIEIFSVGGGRRDDKWCTCLVDKNRVYLVNNGIRVMDLTKATSLVLNIIAQVVEAVFAVRTIRDVGRVHGRRKS